MIENLKQHLLHYTGSLDPESILTEISRWNLRVCVTTSLQTQSTPLLFMLKKLKLPFDIAFLDTGKHYPETLDYLKIIEKKLELDIKVIQAEPSNIYQPENCQQSCCQHRKVIPLRKLLSSYNIWITGIRRDQTTTRKAATIASYDTFFNVLKICPMLEITTDHIEKMVKQYSLPIHPLENNGIRSIGCMPCTSIDKYEGRDGRWPGTEKTECGLHLTN